MIIDFHTHTFPPAIAGRALNKLATNARTAYYTDGTADGLMHSMVQSGIDCSVLLPVATKPSQVTDINKEAIAVNAKATGCLKAVASAPFFLSFGGIHPDCENYREVLRELANEKVPGIKIHPVFQNVGIDDIRFLRIIECASENGLIVLTHAGFDVGYGDNDLASVSRIVRMLDSVHPQKMVLAHMGGWQQWNQVESELVGRDVYLDTAYSLLPIIPQEGTDRRPEEDPPMSSEQFLRIVKNHGADHILFGTDSPWENQSTAIDFIKNSGLTEAEQSAIFSGNALKLLS